MNNIELQHIRSLLKTGDYQFLQTNENLGRNVILLTVGGSYAYGTNVATSDVDIRGCALNNKYQILTNNNFEQYTDNKTDTTIYAFNKLVTLLSNVNPNTIELLGNRPEHYFYVHPIGKELLNNVHMFLSKKAVYSFGGYATQQLRRLENKSNRMVGQAQREKHIYTTIQNASFDFKTKYFPMSEGCVNLYIDKAVNPEYESEIFADINLRHYPLRDYAGMIAEMQSIVSSYNKIGTRNAKAIEHNKISKHMMHLVRLYYMCFDILEREQVITYRQNEHQLLMDIRNGKYLGADGQPVADFYAMVNTLEKRLEYDRVNTNLPEKPNYKLINEFVMSVNERVVRGMY